MVPEPVLVVVVPVVVETVPVVAVPIVVLTIPVVIVALAVVSLSVIALKHTTGVGGVPPPVVSEAVSPLIES